MTGLRQADPQDVPDLLERVARPVGSDVTLPVDFQQVVLQAMPSVLAPKVVAEENVATSLAGRAFTTAAPVTAERADGVRVWVPVHEHSRPAPASSRSPWRWRTREPSRTAALGDLAGLLVAGASRYTDLMHVRRRGGACPWPPPCSGTCSSVDPAGDTSGGDGSA